MAENAKPTDLWTRDELMEELDDIDKRQAENALYNAWRAEKLYRHKNVNNDKQFQYALKIPEINRATPPAPYVASTSPSSGSGIKKRRGVKATPKEIRMAFMQVQNSLAKLEDMIMPIIEDAEEKDKMLNKLRNMF